MIGHKLNAYEKYLLDNKGEFEVYAIVPSSIDKTLKNKLSKSDLSLRISVESSGMGIYKSFNYEIFERRVSVLIAIEGNLAAANLIQEAKNGKARALIYVSANSLFLSQKAATLTGYVNIYKDNRDLNKMLSVIKKKEKEYESI